MTQHAAAESTQARQSLDEALARYRRPDGYEGLLVEAAWRLEQIGPEAWPALEQLLLSGAPESEHFLGAAVRLEGVPALVRSLGLDAAARSEDANVRARLLELLGEVPAALRDELLGELAARSRPQDSVTDRAKEALHERVG